jgi:hypothetical protein
VAAEEVEEAAGTMMVMLTATRNACQRAAEAVVVEEAAVAELRCRSVRRHQVLCAASWVEAQSCCC